MISVAAYLQVWRVHFHQHPHLPAAVHPEAEAVVEVAEVVEEVDGEG
jgi:hypothetical protein